MEPLQLGDVVMDVDADKPTSIPAIRAMRGRVIGVSPSGGVRVQWFDPETGEKLGKDAGYRRPETVKRAP